MDFLNNLCFHPILAVSLESCFTLCFAHSVACRILKPSPVFQSVHFDKLTPPLALLFSSLLISSNIYFYICIVYNSAMLCGHKNEHSQINTFILSGEKWLEVTCDLVMVRSAVLKGWGGASIYVVGESTHWLWALAAPVLASFAIYCHLRAVFLPQLILSFLIYKMELLQVHWSAQQLSGTYLSSLLAAIIFWDTKNSSSKENRDPKTWRYKSVCHVQVHQEGVGVRAKGRPCARCT